MLRAYQRRVLRQLAETDGRVLLQMPTGSGKTITAVEYARDRLPVGPVWFVCHRREIVRQASKAFGEAGLGYGVIAPGHGPNPEAPIQIASVYALRSRDGGYLAPATIIWDEAHHMAAPSWAALMDRYRGAKHVGLTATPERLDGRGLVKWFDNLVIGPSIKSLIDRNHLARYRIFAPTEPDLTAARIKHGDWDPADTDKIMNTPVVIGDAIEHYNRIVPRSRALVFATSIAASQNIARRFAAQGTPAKHIDGETPDAERDAAVADLAAGRLKVLSNVNVFTEGVDVPGIDTVILMRPTRSLALYMQMIGRGLRPSEGKTVATIFDHAGCVYEHGFADAAIEWSLEGGARKSRLRKAREASEVIRRCPECYCAHEISPACPECGFVYGGGQTVGEFDGVLYALRSGTPSGFESGAAFARRHKISYSLVRKWIAMGLETDGRGRINIISGENFISSLRPNLARGRTKSIPIGYVSAAEFAARHSLGSGTVASWVRSGKLLTEGGYLNEKSANNFITSLPLHHNRFKSRAKSSDAYETRADFARRFGVSRAAVTEWCKRGLPTGNDLLIPIEDGLRWVAERQAEYPAKYARPERYESMSEFSRRIGVSPSIVSFWRRKRGLPGVGKLIPIAHGLEWVRKRGTIKIPASAWGGVDPEQRCAAD